MIKFFKLMLFFGILVASTIAISDPKLGKITLGTLKYVEDGYIEQEKVVPLVLLQGAFDALQLRIPEFEVSDAIPPTITATVEYATKRFKLSRFPSLKEVTTLLTSIYQFISENYSGDLKPEEFEYIAIEGMLEKLDPHSNLLTPKIYKEFLIGTKGSFGGVGMIIGVKDGQLAVISPIEGTPAYKAGLLAGDRIVQIGNESTVNVSVTEAVNLLRGDVGTNVSVVIERGTRNERHQFILKRAEIHIDSVQSTLLTPSPDSRIGYIKIKNFQSDTDTSLTEALKKFSEKALLTGLILDLRNNPGGLLDQAAKVADHFLSSGTIVSTVDAKNNDLEKMDAKQQGTEISYPIVVLINEGSASASEIVAEALQYYKRAIVIGQNSFGKGSVQTVFELGNDSALKLTVAKYLAAGKISIEPNGIIPDIELTSQKASPDEMDLIPNVKESELDLITMFIRLKKEKKEKPRAQYAIPYVDVTISKEEMEKQRMEEYSKEPKLDNDIAVKLAQKILTKNKNVSLPEIVKILSNEQDKELEEKLAKFNIDWSKGPENKKPNLDIGFNILKDSHKKSTVTAGEEIELEVSAKNTGTEPVYRLIAYSDSENPIFNELEFPFGKIEPGNTKSWKTKIKVPLATPQQDVAMNIIFNTNKIEAEIPVNAAPKPSFAVSYSLKEKSSYILTATVFNIGQGSTSDQSVATLSTEDGEFLFIKKGRNKLPIMKPGDKKTVDFEFSLQPEAKDKTVKMDLAVLDGKSYVVLNNGLKFNARTGAILPKEKQLYKPPVINISPPPKVSLVPTINLKGMIMDDDAVKDYYLFEDDKKIYYKAIPEPSADASFDIEIPLKKGNNTITFIARDQYNLTSSKTFVIRHTGLRNE